MSTHDKPSYEVYDKQAKYKSIQYKSMKYKSMKCNSEGFLFASDVWAYGNTRRLYDHFFFFPSNSSNPREMLSINPGCELPYRNDFVLVRDGLEDSILSKEELMTKYGPFLTKKSLHVLELELEQSKENGKSIFSRIPRMIAVPNTTPTFDVRVFSCKQTAPCTIESSNAVGLKQTSSTIPYQATRVNSFFPKWKLTNNSREFPSTLNLSFPRFQHFILEVPSIKNLSVSNLNHAFVLFQKPCAENNWCFGKAIGEQHGIVHVKEIELSHSTLTMYPQHSYSIPFQDVIILSKKKGLRPFKKSFPIPKVLVQVYRKDLEIVMDSDSPVMCDNGGQN